VNADAERELSGGTVIWLFIAIELLTFGLFFVGFAAARRSDPVPFVEGQEQLHALSGAINTAVLLCGGWLAARGALANRLNEPGTTAGYFAGAAVTGWNDPWPIARDRLGAIAPQGYTRIGPALRHATAGLAAEPADHRILLFVSDGKPTDYDRYEGRYGIADIRQALREADRAGVHTHALAVDAVARDYLPPMFGPGNWDVLTHPEQLPEVLTTVYGRQTGA